MAKWNIIYSAMEKVAEIVGKILRAEQIIGIQTFSFSLIYCIM